MSQLSTQLDRPYAQQDTTRAAALARILREPDGTLLADMLGLAEPPPPPGTTPACPLCGRPRQRSRLAGWKPCQRALCSGEAS